MIKDYRLKSIFTKNKRGTVIKIACYSMQYKNANGR